MCSKLFFVLRLPPVTSTCFVSYWRFVIGFTYEIATLIPQPIFPLLFPYNFRNRYEEEELQISGQSVANNISGSKPLFRIMGECG
jgi:hypothetical protein